jgi:hypothetical protein
VCVCVCVRLKQIVEQAEFKPNVAFIFAACWSSWHAVPRLKSAFQRDTIQAFLKTTKEHHLNKGPCPSPTPQIQRDEAGPGNSDYGGSRIGRQGLLHPPAQRDASDAAMHAGEWSGLPAAADSTSAYVRAAAVEALSHRVARAPADSVLQKETSVSPFNRMKQFLTLG